MEISPFEHIIRSQQFDEEYLSTLFSLTKNIKSDPRKFTHSLDGRIVATLFYEPSTRTRFSFESAALRLGANKITTENANEFSSASKGETIEDTIRVMNGYVDFIVMRHNENDACEKAVEVSKVPIINAGTGTGQHPTQALLDMYTIHEYFGKTKDLEITFVGDLLRGRTVNSLVYLMSKFHGNKFNFISPNNSKIKRNMLDHLDEQGAEYTESEDMAEVLKKSDVLYMTRVQKERFDDPKEYEEAKGKYVLTGDQADTMPKKGIIIHPLPRVDEIAREVDANPRARYFEQAENGLYVRMAVLKLLNEHMAT